MSDKLPGSDLAHAMLSVKDHLIIPEVEGDHLHTREDKTVQDEQGLVHYAVHSNRDGGQPYVTAMCDVFAEIDKAFAAENPQSFNMPARRWPVEQETEGVVSCLQCLGI
jgi:hypothetical protein